MLPYFDKNKLIPIPLIASYQFYSVGHNNYAPKDKGNVQFVKQS